MHQILRPFALALVAATLLLPALVSAGDTVERTGVVRRGDQPMTLLGPEAKVGDKAKTAPLWDNDLNPRIVDFADGRVRVVLFVPSIDTPTCSLQTRTFNTRASEAGGGTEVLVVSRDLPYAQKRFCAANGIKMVAPLSDYRTGGFGKGWGLLVKETDLLARAVAIVDGAGVIQYLEIVENLRDEPKYDEAMAALAKLTAK
jgi:thioredoxin-dependent peroxiredoxin